MKVLKIVLGIIGGLLVLFILLGVVINKGSSKIVENVDIAVERIDAENVSQIIYTLKNTSDTIQELDSIDIDLSVFDHAELVNVNMQRTTEYTAFGMRTYEFKRDIAPDETIEVIFDFTRKTSEGHFIETDICINAPSICTGRSFNI